MGSGMRDSVGAARVGDFRSANLAHSDVESFKAEKSAHRRIPQRCHDTEPATARRGKLPNSQGLSSTSPALLGLHFSVRTSGPPSTIDRLSIARRTHLSSTQRTPSVPQELDAEPGNGVDFGAGNAVLSRPPNSRAGRPTHRTSTGRPRCCTPRPAARTRRKPCAEAGD